MTRGIYNTRALERQKARIPGVLIGQDWFHSVADRKAAVAQIAAGFRDLMLELAQWHEARAHAQHARATAQWVSVSVLPTIEEWNAFAARETRSWWIRAATTWQTFGDWMERLRELRELARAHGIALESPEPAPLPKTLWEQGEAGHGNPVAPWFGLAKSVFASVLMIVGGFTVASKLKAITQRPPHPPE